jgi:Cu-Zn family superoxide dismutase
MRKLVCLLFVGLLAAGASSVLAQVQPLRGTAEFKTSVGETVGDATLTQNADGAVRLQVQVRGLPPGVHGIHIHAVGACAPTFAAAGPHYNPMNKKHGLESPDGPHAGDLLNLTIGADGTGSMDATTTMVSLTPGEKTVFDADGSAIVIHAFQDDQKTDPAGNSGERIACAVIQPIAAGQVQPTPATGGAPQQLPNTGGTDWPWLALSLAALCLAAGMLVVRSLRTRS